MGRRTGTRHLNLRAVASAVLMVAAFSATDAWALALGRASVQSHLGEPLRAAIDIPSITPEEATSLQVRMASPETFRAASMGYHPMLPEVQVRLERREDGRFHLRLTSDRVVNEPFLDFVIEASWSGGRLVRGYTMLFDPPNLRPLAPAPLLPLAPSPAAPIAPPAPPAPVAVTPPPVPAMPATAAPERAAPPAAASPAPAQRPAPVRRITVAAGDTASHIALAHKPVEVSLDQMLVALLRQNPSAFIGDNVNRMRAGAVLEMPDAAALAQVSPAEARRIIAAQSRDFNEFRRRLAAAAPAQATETPGRSATGTVQTDVSVARPATESPDRLTLSKGSVQAGTNDAEARIAEQRQEAESSTRVAELARNLEELNRLSEAAQSVPAGEPAATGSPEPASPASAPGPTVEAPTLADPAATETPPAPDDKPAVEPAAPPTPPPAPTVPATASVLDELLANPMTLPAAGGLLALLLLLGLVRMRRKKAPPLATAGPGASDAGDTFVDDAGEGQVIDTGEDAGPASSMMYSPSQLDAGDVDPVAEADVYLAYGRDKQAEEILHDALRTHPERLAIHLKLLEIFAQRKDPVAFEATATEVFALTHGMGPEWEQVRGMGRALDPDNVLFQADAEAGTPEAPGDLPALEEDPSTSGVDFDPTSPPPIEEGSPVLAQATPPSPPPVPDDFSLDFEVASPAPAPAPEPEADETAAAPRPSQDLDFDLDLSELGNGPVDDGPTNAAAPSPRPLDLDGLSLDLDAMPTADEPAMEAEPDALADLEMDEEPDSSDPLETKLSLAEEFEAIGDTEGARSLAEEVQAEASGDLQARARAFLARLG